MNLQELIWHDGTIDDVRIQLNEINLNVSVYLTDQDSVRIKVILQCEKVISFAGVLDFQALRINKTAGNINDGRFEIKQTGVMVLKLFLTDGYVEISAETIGARLVSGLD